MDLGEGHFKLGALGCPMLWCVLGGCGATVLPTLLWCCSSLPKAGGKKTKDEELLGVRQALKSILNLYHLRYTALLSSIDEELASADQKMSSAAFCFFSAEDIAGVDIASPRARIEADLHVGHRQGLMLLRQCLLDRMALLKTKAGFKA